MYQDDTKKVREMIMEWFSQRLSQSILKMDCDNYMMVSWLCALSIAIPVYMICHIIGKRMLSNRTENYLG